MNSIVTFFKDIFTLDDSNSMAIGLSEFKSPEPKATVSKKPVTAPAAEMKLSDLMRKKSF